MTDTFILSCRLKFAYRTNNIIHSVKSIPLIKKLLPDNLYSSTKLKSFVNVISVINEILGALLGKFNYFALLIYLPSIIYQKPTNSVVLTIFFCLTLIGSVLNNRIFEPSKDKYYGIFVMRLDAREYVLSNFFYFLIKSFVSFVPFVILLSFIANLNIFVCLLMPLYVVAVKLLAAGLMLKAHYFSNEFQNSKLFKFLLIFLAVLLLAAAYIPPIFGIFIPVWFFVVFTFLLTAAAVPSLFYLLGYDGYRYIYKTMFSEKGDALFITASSNAAIQQITLKQVVADTGITSSKQGCAYLNDLFIKRHRKILNDSAHTISVIEAVLFLAAAGFCLIIPDYNSAINKGILTYFPFSLFFMYLINRGASVTRAMFMNCDHSLLSYRFFRQPDIILKLFTERLKSIFIINLLPSLVAALGIPLILYITGSTSIENYLLIFASIIMMTVFFSIHHLVIYYLHQPYNMNFQIKSSFYSIINFATYYICFLFAGKEAPLLIFCAGVSLFSLAYAIISLILLYNLAPKTFKLRP